MNIPADTVGRPEVAHARHVLQRVEEFFRPLFIITAMSRSRCPSVDQRSHNIDRARSAAVHVIAIGV